MNKKTCSFIAVYAIFFVVFNVVALVIPFESYVSRWISYAFMNIAIIASAVIAWIAFSKGEDVKSKFYGFPIFRVGMIYVAIQFAIWMVVSCLCFVVEVPAWISIVLSIVLLGFALTGVIATDTVRDFVEEQDKKIVTETRAIKTFSLDVESLIPACKDDQLKKAVEKLAEKVRYSDPISSEATEEIENKIQKEVDSLEVLVETDYSAAMEKVSMISSLIENRNINCKRSK